MVTKIKIIIEYHFLYKSLFIDTSFIYVYNCFLFLEEQANKNRVCKYTVKVFQYKHI